MNVAFRRASFGAGTVQGAVVRDGVGFGAPAGRSGAWEYARWVGPETAVAFGATELVLSWTADTPPGTWIEIGLRGTCPSTPWYVLGRWAYGDGDVRRASVPAQADEHARVAVDTLVAAPGRPWHAYQTRLTLFRRPGMSSGPRVLTQGTMASAVYRRRTTRPDGFDGIELEVPRRSQYAHRHPHWGGGAAWCSPTCMAMVLSYWNAGPDPVEERCPSGAAADVDHAARHVYDHAFAGTGNWPFNTAYAGRFGLDGFVTRLRGLPEAEVLLRAGVPLVASLAFGRGDLPGAGYATGGHLLVITGVTPDGDVIVNDPAAPDHHGVRRVYPREPFERCWHAASGGVVYVIHPPGHALPPPPDPANW
ncbi:MULTISPECIES: peptidase C39 family protein [Actinomadura]|uniref:Peptidase C39 family protein n=1 Tax=Actinomadura yumaensis TaxID=111807 RepID=A0ABW2CIT6_9ACTN|nr:peptidase C39 family protein [Actinomadura sp. J1-007]MWK40030.1 peptidase C39 family protein [Actinomadura sp. J1-007]